MRLSTGLAAAAITVSPVADAADGPERQDGKTHSVDRADLDIAASEADDGTTLKIAPGKEFLVALHGKVGSDGCWRILQFDSAVLQGIRGTGGAARTEAGPRCVRLPFPRDFPLPGEADGRDRPGVRLFQPLGANAA